jgi:hypothetical protein
MIQHLHENSTAGSFVCRRHPCFIWIRFAGKDKKTLGETFFGKPPYLPAPAASLFMKMKGFHPDRSSRGNRIITVRAPGMAAGDTAECQPKSFEGAMDLDRFNGIDRTGGDMAAGSREERGNGIFIKIDQSQEHPAQHFHHPTDDTRHKQLF